jgi:predicted DNA-binding transcriptional regulator YafY
MSTGNHDTLVYRLAQILIKLNQGEKLEPQALAEEFGVALRTIQRDLNVRFAYLPLEKVDGFYRLDPTYLGQLNTRDIERFASLAGVHGLFPSLSDDFLRDIFDSRIQSALLVKGHNYEVLAGKEKAFSQLEQAIVSRRHVSFDYQKEEGRKHYKQVSPFKLMNHKGIWYLAARDGEKLKTFAFTKIERLQMLESQFSADPTVEKTLREEDGISTFQPNRALTGHFFRLHQPTERKFNMSRRQGLRHSRSMANRRECREDRGRPVPLGRDRSFRHEQGARTHTVDGLSP